MQVVFYSDRSSYKKVWLRAISWRVSNINFANTIASWGIPTRTQPEKAKLKAPVAPPHGRQSRTLERPTLHRPPTPHMKLRDSCYSFYNNYRLPKESLIVSILIQHCVWRVFCFFNASLMCLKCAWKCRQYTLIFSTSEIDSIHNSTVLKCINAQSRYF